MANARKMFMASRIREIVAIFIISAMIFGAAAHGAQLYHNEEYGFSVSVPRGLALCREPPPNPDHGLTILLSPSVSCMTQSQAEARINIRGEFKAAEYSSLQDLKNSVCGQTGLAESPLASPSILGRETATILSHETASCAVKTRSHKVEVWVLVQNAQGSNADIWINYEISLKTSSDRLNNDLEVLRRILHGMRLLKPE